MMTDRTKAVLVAYEARGGVLGVARPDGGRLSPEASARGRLAAVKAIREKARAAYADLAPMIRELRGEGLSLQRVADVLNSEGHTTRRGMPWNPVQVGRVLERVGG